ncbi:hypothetical protein QCE48_02785 [Caballeronia sp. LZ024]|nr:MULTISPECIES: hypothetical protein [unclassified Caballeronia]MDR5749723.1 hypothetical protein [Caballeronia sp. LZ024]MDR5843148.1 hypothetical protein [Caballeronia sp. LZ031]
MAKHLRFALAQFFLKQARALAEGFVRLQTVHIRRHVLDAMDDIEQAAVGGEHRSVYGIPVSKFEAAFRPIGHVIPLNSHDMGLFRGDDGRERSAQVRRGARLGRRRIVGENVEDAFPDDVFPDRERLLEIRVACRGNREGAVGPQDQQRAGYRFEQKPEILGRQRTLTVHDVKSNEGRTSSG